MTMRANGGGMIRAALLALGVGGLAMAGSAGRAGTTAAAQPNAAGLLRSELIFPLDALHNHSSCIVQAPNGDLLVCWYRGSGERRADDVQILGARLRKGGRAWSEPSVLADVPGFPDCNPCLLVDPQGRLWLFWVTIQANEWHTALLKYRMAEKYSAPGPPRWSREGVIHLKPGEEFPRLVSESVDRDLAALDRFPESERGKLREYLEARRRHAADHYFNRLGWMPRAHPFVLDGKRLILPLYSDGFDFSLMAITDDWGENWQVSLPLISDGGVQPSIARRRDGALATYMRDNGPPPNRLLYSESRDGGKSWSLVTDTEIPNPGSGAEVVGLRDGTWALIYNDTEKGRHSLAVSLSDDDGRTWKWTRHLERDLAPGGGSYSYPSLIEAADGTLHATYSYVVPDSQVKRDEAGRALRESIRHVQFTREWVRAGDS